MDILLNPAVVSIIILCILCLKRINVLLAIIIATLLAGFLSGMDVERIMNVLISGMGGNSETALSYILLGAFAATMAYSGFTNIISSKILQVISGKKWMLLLILVLISMTSQNIIPIHIAFIPIIIPPLLSIMNKLNIDRRAVASVLAFGLKMPYLTIPVGFGLIFHNLIADNLISNGLDVVRTEIWKYTAILGLGMIVALIIAIFISYRKTRFYEDKPINIVADSKLECSKYTICIVSLAALLTFIVQLCTHSLPLGAIVGLGTIFTFRVIPKNNMDNMVNEGIYLMGYVAFVMLVAAGFAAVLKESGAIDSLLNAVVNLLPSNILITSLIILLLGLFITIGIGSSFGTIPILAVLFVPICINQGFNTPQIIILIAAAAALGDAGSPASDTTLGPTAGLNADGQHNHIFDTCIPTFLHYNVALIIFAILGIWLFA